MMLKAKVAMCPACSRRISVNANECPKCGEPLTGNWAEVQVKKEGKIVVWGTIIVFSIMFLPYACSKINSGSSGGTNSNSTYSPRTYSSDGYRNGTLYKDGKPVKNGYQSNLERMQREEKNRPRTGSKLPSECWSPGNKNSSNCQGEVNSNAFSFCPSNELYEATRDMLPTVAAQYGCEADVKGRLVKVLSCTQTTCQYSLYYGYDEWRVMWSQAGIVNE